MSIRHLTDLTPEVIEPAARTYNSSFNIRTFYVLRAVFPDVTFEQADVIGTERMKQYVYRGIKDHELYAAFIDDHPDPAALMVLKAPVDDGPPYPVSPTPYDDEVERIFPKDAQERDALVHEYMKKLGDRSWGDTRKYTYYVSYLATAPWAQKRGLGSKLVQVALDRAKAEGRDVTLSTHTKENAQFYERKGFKTLGYDEWQIGDVPFTWYCMSTDMNGAKATGT